MLDVNNLGRRAAVVLAVGVTAGCAFPPPTSPPDAVLQNTATVSVNGQSTGERYYVTCKKTRWLLTIDSVDDAAGFTALIDTDGVPEAKFVKIRDVDGFTGSAWEGGVGQATAKRDDRTITLTGSGYGVLSDNPGPATAAFTITTTC